MRSISTLLLFIISAVALGQTGTYVLRHYQPEGETAGQTAFDIIQDNNGLMYFAVSRGILRFDGKSWDLIRTGGAIYDLFVQENILYTAGSRGAGRMDISRVAGQTHTLIPSAVPAPVFQIAAASGNIFFVGDRNIYCLAADSVRFIAQAPSEWISVASIGGNVYASSAHDKAFLIRDNKLTQPQHPLLQNTSIVFAETWNNSTLFCTTDNQLYLLEPEKLFRRIKLVDSAYADAGVIVNGCWVTPDLIALGTLRGGVMFVNPHNGRTEQIINYMAGLPDNEVYALATDKSKNVWIAHRYGFTRIAPFLPFRSFAHYPGLQGNSLCAERHSNSVYVGTSLGLYRLNREDRYDEIVYYVSVPVTGRTSQKNTGKNTQTEEPRPEKDRSGLFGFLRKHKPTVRTQAPDAEAKEVTVSYRREKRTRRTLRSSEYAFRKIPGIDARVSQLLIWDGKLIASGLAGVWEVENEKARLVLDEPVRYVLTQPGANTLLAISYEGKLYRLHSTGRSEPYTVSDTSGYAVQYAFAGKDSSVWLCGTEIIYRLTKNGELKKLPIENPDYGPVYGVIHQNHVLFLASGKAYALNEHTFRLSVIDSLYGISEVLPDGQSLWLRSEKGWRILGTSVSAEAASLLSVIPDITGIHAEQSTGNLWIATSGGELIYFRRDAVLPVAVYYPLLLKSVSINHQPVDASQRSIRLVGEANPLRIHVVLPEYSSPDLVQYRYKLGGLNSEWSSWSQGHATLDFPFLPEGKYRLEIQAQTHSGYITDPEVLHIHVLPPYWNRWWFYALEFGVFSLLVISSFRLSSRYRIISRVLSLLSIIILIEFIQTVAGTTFALEGGPVVEFLVQVGIAFIILPVEGFLRNFMIRSIEKNK